MKTAGILSVAIFILTTGCYNQAPGHNLIQPNPTSLAPSESPTTLSTSPPPLQTAKPGEGIQLWLPNHDTRINNLNEHAYMAMLTADYGWKLDLWNMAGMHGQPVELLRTTDGGKTWLTLAKATLTGGAIPVAGGKMGLSLLNQQTGWISVLTPRQGFVGLYRTLDGGKTWEEEPLNIPKEFKNTPFYASPPVFFSSLDGLFLANWPMESNFLFYMTKDGGKSWSPLVNQRKGETNSIKWDFTNDQKLTVSYKGVPWVSIDHGGSWNPSSD